MMTTIKKIGLIASLAFASNFAVANHGVPYDMDTFATPLVGGDIEFSATFSTNASGYFGEEFTFTVDNTAPLWDFSAFFESSIATLTFSDISVTNTSGYDAVGVMGNSFSTATLDSATATNYTLLAPGVYTLYLNGMGTSVTDEYTLNAVLSPVPEPASIALMLGGLGLVGFMAARRRKNA